MNNTVLAPFAVDAFLHAPLDPDDTIVPPSSEHLTIDARCTEEPQNHPDVVEDPFLEAEHRPRDS